MLLLLLLTANLAAEPRPINDAEREAAVLAATFLATGPEALYARLSSDAPLRALPRDEALRELAVRTGPAAGATWSLQTVDGSANDAAFRVRFPSGYDDGLLFRMKRKSNRWMLHELLTLAEHPEGRKVPAPPPERRSLRAHLLIASGIIALLGIFVRGARKGAFVLALAGIIGAWLNPSLPAPAPKKALPFVELRALMPLREALARGDDARIPQGAGKEAHNVGLLWLLASGVPVDVPGNAKDPLAGLGVAAKTQLAEIVRARIAMAEERQDEAVAAFERAVAMKPLRDDVLVEAVTSFTGPRADRFLANRFQGSRDANWYYARAVTRPDRGQANDAFLLGWGLAPKPREELIRDPRLLALVVEPAIAAAISFLGDREPALRVPALAKTPAPWPTGAQAFATGETLRLQLGEAALEVPMGAMLAPKHVRVVPATYWRAQKLAAGLREAEALLEVPSRATSPASRGRVLRAAQGLAEHNRWADLVRLTSDITPASKGVPPDLLVLRMRALLRTGRMDEARALAAGEAVTELGRRKAPAALLAIADAMGARGEWKLATALFYSVSSQEHLDLVRARIRQLERRSELAAAAETHATKHFDIRHEPTVNPAIVGRIGDFLEAELVRLQQKLPAVQPRRVAVNVLQWDDFRGNITGSDHILGLYDGEILFPFAVVNQFKPEVVAIITHELTHALLAQVTGDNAPRWFQEGVAQRMELVPSHPNPFSTTSAEKVLPVPLLDAVMENATDAYSVDHGYRVAHAFIRFLETRYGDKAIATLAAEFTKGTNTDDALAVLTNGKSVDELNQEFRAWGFANNADFVNNERWPYGHLYSPGIDPRVREGFKWGGKRPSS